MWVKTVAPMAVRPAWFAVAANVGNAAMTTTARMVQSAVRTKAATARIVASKTAAVVVKVARFVVRSLERAPFISVVRAVQIAIAPLVNSAFGPVMVAALFVATHASRITNASIGCAVMTGVAPNAAMIATVSRASAAMEPAPNAARIATALRVPAATALVPAAAPRRTVQTVSIATLAPVPRGAERTAIALPDCTASMGPASSAVQMRIVRMACAVTVLAPDAAITTIVPRGRIAPAALVLRGANRIAIVRAGIVALTFAPNVA